MARLSSRVLPVCLVTVLVSITLWSLPPAHEEAFVPTSRRGALAALGAAVAGVAAGTPEPAQAAGAKFSVFGFGLGNEATSDPYNSLDDDSDNPYSQFSNAANADYKKADPAYIAQQKALLTKALPKLDDCEKAIELKKIEEVKMQITRAPIRAPMLYLSGEKDSAAYKKARDFMQSMADMLVCSNQGRFPDAKGYWSQAKIELAEWKAMVNF